MLLLGAAWWIVWTLGNGFCNDFISFNVVRAVSGMGGAMVVPNAVAIVGMTFPPGRMRNRCLGLIGAGAPIGGWTGELIFCLVWSNGGVVEFLRGFHDSQFAWIDPVPSEDHAN